MMLVAGLARALPRYPPMPLLYTTYANAGRILLPERHLERAMRAFLEFHLGRGLPVSIRISARKSPRLVSRCRIRCFQLELQAANLRNDSKRCQPVDIRKYYFFFVYFLKREKL